MFETTVYRECYPFSKEVLYDAEKSRLFVKLLHQRRLDLFTIHRYAPKWYSRKQRLIVLRRVERENEYINEILDHIQNGHINNIDTAYASWLVAQYKTKFLWRVEALHSTWNR